MKLDDVIHTLTGVRASALERRRLRAEIVAGPDQGQQLAFEHTLRIGTRKLAQLVVRDPLVSGVHCEILAGPPIRVRDLGSKNGTIINGVRVFDALLRPGDVIQLGSTHVRIVEDGARVAVQLHPSDQFEGIVGQSAAIRALTARLQRLATTDTTVLVTGEHGTGKELVAHALHRGGPRAPAPLEIIDCGALPSTLIESELFGYEKGAFTGAANRQAGAFERARGGTVFLDEIGELPLELQPKLLRVLESRTVRRLGGSEVVSVDARVVAATNRDLALEVQRGRFREDLYYRLAVVVLTVPPLRERIEDIPLLAVRLLDELGVDPEQHLRQESLGALMRHDWPGNVRELRNTLERAVSLLEPLQPMPRLAAAAPGEPASSGHVDTREPLRVGKQRVTEAYERAYITALLHECQGNVTEAARRAGMDRVSIHRLLHRLGLRS